jgi:hypothetical protein
MSDVEWIMVNEVRGWMEEGVSLLDKLWQAFVEAEPALVIDSS